MRFLKGERFTFAWTSRKEKAAERRLRLERESLPLFADDIAGTQPTIDEIKADREQGWIESEREWRAARAQKWRAARRRYFALPDDIREAVLEDWNGRSMLPADPWYLHSVIRRYESTEARLSEAATQSKGRVNAV